MRRLKNKSAIIVLITNYLTMSLFYYAIAYGTHDAHTAYYITFGPTVLLVGWLADVILGRYRTIRWSILIMWTGTMLSTASSVVAYFTTTYNRIDEYMSLVLLIIATVGLGSYQANVVQFGLDQLQDASTDEITSYLSWFAWTVISGGIFVVFVDECIKDTNHIPVRFLVCFCLSIALIIFILSKNVLTKEPVTQNPFRLVYKVIKYAAKNKRPRCRSAFTYCEDDFPSRIDFGKSKYGGPFTTEQVEDVKTFFRLLSFICLGCTLPGTVTAVNLLTVQLNYPIHESKIANTKTVSCYQFYEQVISPTLIALLIPLYEFVIYPVVRRHFSWVRSHLKILFGVLLQIAEVIALK